MGPAKSSCLGNKRLYKVVEDWLDKDVGNACKSKVKKRKLSDMLNYRWSKGELNKFYNAFRKYGKNWKKVARFLRNRSMDMVESLYFLNRAYLSLPEGMATADGFLAMMTDHYNNLDADDSGYESNDASEKTLNHLQRRVKCQQNKEKVHDGYHLENPSALSSYRCTPKTYSGGIFTDMWLRVAGKRTPRIRITNNQGDGDNSVSTNKHIIKPALNENVCTSALTLLKASKGGGSQLPSGSSGRSVLIQSVSGKHAEADVATSSDINVQMDENYVEGHSGRRVVDNDIFGRDLKQLDIDGVDQCGSQCKVKMLSEMSPKVQRANDFQFNGFGTCNGRGKGFKDRKSKDKIDKEVSEKIMVQSSQGLGEKSHMLFLEDEDRGLDPLQVLADVSLNIDVQDFAGNSAILQSVNTRISSEEDKGYSSALTGKSDEPISLPATPESDNFKILVRGDREYSSIVIVDGGPQKATKLRKAIFRDEISVKNSISEEHDKCPCISMTQHNIGCNRRIPEGEIHYGSCVDESKNKGDTIYAIPDTIAAANDDVAGAQHTTCGQPCMLAKIRSCQSYIKAAANEEVRKELRHTNADVSEKGMAGELVADSKHATEHTKKVIDEAASVSFDLEQHNTYNKNSRPPWFRPSESSTENSGRSGSLTVGDVTREDSGSYVVEIARSFRQKARSMVGTAVMAMCSLEEGEDAYTRITEALDCADNQRYGVDSKTLGTRYSNLFPLTCQNEADFAATVNAFNPRACFSSGNEAQILSELISDCIAIVFMIQATSERQYPPAQVARILEDAVESLQPRCLQNLPLYIDIEKCMGCIKTQMLALVATPNGTIPAHISV